jgi:hypothetical protein
VIERIPELPDHVLGFSAKGKVTAEDYEKVLIPAVEKELKENKKIRFLYHFGEDFESFAAGAMWEDTKVGLSHFAAWEKIAIVTDIEWLRVTMKVFGFVMPGVVRIFGNSEYSEAVKWLSE